MPETRRPRAPTIQIDTSAVGGPDSPRHIPLELLTSNSPTITQRDASRNPSPNPALNSPPSDNNTLSPNYLAVPRSVNRSRGASFDSTADTAIAGSSASYNGDLSPSTFGDSTLDLPAKEEALRPDPGHEAEFNVENNKFPVTPGQLSKLINPKSLAAFRAFGGPAGFERCLRTNLKSGLSSDETHLDDPVSFEEATNPPHSVEPKNDNFQAQVDSAARPSPASGGKDIFADRIRVFGDNRLPERKSKSIWQLMWQAYKDKILILLTIAAVISLAVGVSQSVTEPGPGTEWIEGVAIVIAIFIVVMVGAINDWQKEKQFVKLNKKKDDRLVKVVRSGKTQEIPIFDVLVGDIMLLETGDAVPVDGILIEGQSLRCDESSATGESDLIRKHPAADVWRAIENQDSLRKLDPFILSGSKVSEGVGKFVVTATGVNSSFGKTMMSLREENEVTPLQLKLNVIADYIAKLGMAAVLLYFTIAFIEFLVRITSGSEQNMSPAQKGQDFLQIFIISISVIVVAVPEGLPLAVTLALAFATTRMLKDNNLVRLLRSCETMGNATTICSDKTGTLTQNKMTVVAGTLGTSSRFGDSKDGSEDAELEPTSPDDYDVKLKKKARKRAEDVSSAEFTSTLHADVRQCMLDSIALNSTAFDGEEDGKKVFIGSKTETALLEFARLHLGMGPVSEERASAVVSQMVPFDSSRKCMGVVIKKSDKVYRLFVKGASEILLSKCTKTVRSPPEGMQAAQLTQENREDLQHIISVYASRSLRTIAMTYRDFESWPPPRAKRVEDDRNQVDFDDIHKDMNLLGIVGIQDPLRPGVQQAVNDCRRAGVFVRMVTGDNVQTAKAIAAECGIYTSGGIVMEGPEFRKLRGQQLDDVMPKLQVLARSSPEDKRKLVKHLKKMGETVAVTGDGTNDAPALKLADVGFSMGISGTEVAKEASAIILMDDNFGSIVKALMWGRAVNDAVKKFLQFQITVNISAVVITFVSGIGASNGTPVLRAVQLLWVNLIMDTMAALALATDPPSESILDRRPDRKSAGLISVTMWKMIFGQAIYQIVVIFVFYFAGANILSYQSESEKLQLQTLIFNMFVWMQIFNAFNNRRLDNKFNIFEGVMRNWFFIGILSIMVGVQILIMFVGGDAFNIYRQRPAQWAYALILGFLSIPIGMTIRLIPDELILLLIPDWIKKRSQRKREAQDEEDHRFEWNAGIEKSRHELAFMKRLKGGRLNQLSFAVRHPMEAGILPGRLSSANRSRSSTLTQGPPGSSHETQDAGSRSMSPHESRPSSHRRSRSRSNTAFGSSVIAAGIVAGSIAGWSPIERPDRDDEPPKK